MDWFKGKITGKYHISWENLWFPVDFFLNQSIETSILRNHNHQVVLAASKRRARILCHWLHLADRWFSWMRLDDINS